MKFEFLASAHSGRLAVAVAALFLIGSLANAAGQVLSNNLIDDDIHFDIKWPGALLSPDEELQDGHELVQMTSVNNEKFQCRIPVVVEDEDSEEERIKKVLKEASKNLIETSSLLNALYTKKLCSYRIESYWIYELCHGQYVKQYHETKQAGRKTISVEYFLGYFNQANQEPDYEIDVNNEPKPNVHWKTLDGKSMPMYAVKYLDGTPCDIMNNKPREITIFYACEENGNENVVSFEEISSCVYEMIVVTRAICEHPAYKLPEKTQKTISCFTLQPGLPKPESLVAFEQDRDSLMRNHQNKVKMTNRQGDTFIVHYKTIDSDDQAAADSNDASPPGADSYEETTVTNQQHQQQQQQNSMFQEQSAITEDAEKEVIAAFVSGTSCLTGGVGWWKYEVCLGKHVHQYHEDENTKKRTNILLGTWSRNDHLDWLKSHPNKRPLSNPSERTTVTHLFSNGDRCDQTGKPRFVEVKLRCLRIKEKAFAVSLYLMEPLTCEYILTVESPWLCDFVESADMNGFAKPKEEPTVAAAAAENPSPQQQQKQPTGQPKP